MVKVIYSACHGGFGLSEAAMRRYAEIKGLRLYPEANPHGGGTVALTYWTVPPEQRAGILTGQAFATASMEAQQASSARYQACTIEPDDIARHDPALVHVVEELGAAANGAFADLKIAEIEGERYRIIEYYGWEDVVAL